MHFDLKERRRRSRTLWQPTCLLNQWVENITASGEDAMWMRSCAVCKAIMMKLRLRDTVCCPCGWKWEW